MTKNIPELTNPKQICQSGRSIEWGSCSVTDTKHFRHSYIEPETYLVLTVFVVSDMIRR